MAAPDNPWLRRRVLAFAHQGGAAEGPSSTLWAMERALEVGADALELDVHATADGQLVVCHDPTLERTTDRTGAIARAQLAELRGVDAAYHFVPGEGARPGRGAAAYPLRGRALHDGRLGLATLEAVLERFPGVPLNLDVKQRPPTVPAYEHRLVELLRAHGRGDDVIVAAFDERSTDAVAALAPEVAVSAGRRSVAAFAAAVRLRLLNGRFGAGMPGAGGRGPVRFFDAQAKDELLAGAGLVEIAVQGVQRALGPGDVELAGGDEQLLERLTSAPEALTAGYVVIAVPVGSPLVAHPPALPAAVAQAAALDAIDRADRLSERLVALEPMAAGAATLLPRLAAMRTASLARRQTLRELLVMLEDNLSAMRESSP